MLHSTLQPYSELAILSFFYFTAFVLERGRVALHLNTTDVECKKVTFKPTSFQSNEGKINVQTSINYFNSTASFVHDAAVTWVESVTHLNFKLCALKAGRAERLTPDNGLTFVDYVAIQESPAGAAAGHLRMPMKWWDGTTCETLKFEQVIYRSLILLKQSCPSHSEKFLTLSRPRGSPLTSKIVWR